MKKTYQSPVTMTVKIGVVALQSASKTGGNTNIKMGGRGGSTEQAQSRRNSWWDEEED